MTYLTGVPRLMRRTIPHKIQASFEKKKHLRRSESADDIGTVEKRGHPHLRAPLACIKSLVHVDVYAYVSFGDSDAKAVLNERIKIC